MFCRKRTLASTSVGEDSHSDDSKKAKLITSVSKKSFERVDIQSKESTAMTIKYLAIVVLHLFLHKSILSVSCNRLAVFMFC